MGFFDKIKAFFKKLKEDNAGFGTTMKRINSSGYCGNVNRGIKNGDFWEGSYISVEGQQCVIYGSNQPDYYFGKDDIEAFEKTASSVSVACGGKELPGTRYLITFKDGKRAQADVVDTKISEVKLTLGL